jgi:hypothetical protein
MPKLSLFVQTQGDNRVIEVAVDEKITESELYKALLGAGVTISSDQFVYIDETEDQISSEGKHPVAALKQGMRVHVARCRRIKTTVNYLERTIHREFAPGTRVRTVKKWATHEFELDKKDGAEHVLQICNSKDRPASDTPLHALVEGGDCSVCFDLVPEIRVEG